MAIEKALYTAQATSTGGRTGTTKSSDGRIELQLSTPKTLGGDDGPGTNPEQLFASGYSACFIGAMKAVAARQKISLPANVSIKSDVSIGPMAGTLWVSVQEWTGPNGATGWVEKMNRMEIPLQILESSSNKLVTKIADPKLPFGGTWTYEVQPDGTGSAVTITEDGEVYNPIFRFVSKFIMGHASTINGYLRALGKKFGQDVMLQ